MALTAVCVCVRAGEKGRRIRELTSVVQKRFKFPEGSVELYAEKVGSPCIVHESTGTEARTTLGPQPQTRAAELQSHSQVCLPFWVHVPLDSSVTLCPFHVCAPCRLPTAACALWPRPNPCATSCWVAWPCAVPATVSCAS